jgi:hypothetical protein
MIQVQLGERFGDLTVIETGLRAAQSPWQRANRKLGERAALTLCDCGSEHVAKLSYLTRGLVTSCGCKPTPRPSRRPPTVLTTDEVLERPTVSDDSAPVHDEATAGSLDGAAGSHEATPVQDDSAPAPPRRQGRRPKQIDTSSFEAVMAEALLAYSVDVGYAVSMMNSANQIQRKRNTWQVRSELRRAEADARAACESSQITACVVTEPCSTGSCPFSQGDLADLVGVPSLPTSSSTSRATRPVPRPEHVPGHVYSIEAALQPLIELRTRLGTLHDSGDSEPAENTA